jgi:peptide/nickel transport system permease protein
LGQCFAKLKVQVKKLAVTTSQKGSSLWLFTGKRILQAVPLVLGAALVNFTLIQLAPGDPVTVLVGDYPAPPEYVAQVRADFGLDQPLWTRAILYFGNLLRGNLGFSFANRQPVVDLILQRLLPTLLLTVTALVFASLIGLLLGMLAAVKRGKLLDRLSQSVALIGYSVPEFWLGQLLILLFAVGLTWLPSQGMQTVRSQATGFDAVLDILKHLILPALALSVRYIALITRITRASMLEVLHSDFVLAARAKGILERRVLFSHILKNAAAPIITVLGFNFGYVLAGSALIETVFGWPGIGRLLFDSISKRDYPVLTGILLLLSISVVVANFLTDLAYALFDPRVRY